MKTVRPAIEASSTVHDDAPGDGSGRGLRNALTTPPLEPSPRALTLTAGLLYVALVLVGPFSLMYVPGVLREAGDVVTTAQNIQASQTLLRLGLSGMVVIALIEVVLSAVLYVLFRQVSVTLALVAALARSAMAVVQAVTTLPGFAILILVNDGQYLAGFDAGQMQAMTAFLLETQIYGAHLWEAFFALHCAFLAVLLFASGYFPRVLGPLMGVAALGYLLSSFGTFLAPDYQGMWANLAGIAAMVGEVPFMFWLLFKGVNLERWRGSRSPRR